MAEEERNGMRTVEKLPTRFVVPPGCFVDVYQLSSWSGTRSYIVAEYGCWCGFCGSTLTELDAVNDLAEHLYIKHRQWPAREL